MSVHKSLFIGGALLKQRSVWTRRERLEKLAKEGSWNEGESVFGLPKVRTQYKVVGKKKKKAAEAEPGAEVEAAAEGAESAEGGAGGESAGAS